ncbi:MAG: LuxR C-terminal-related transcriptional regulator [Planctomycetota bacterium]
MSKSIAIRSTDVKELLAVAAGLAERSRLSSTERQEFALKCLCKHLRARAGIFGIFRARPPSDRPMYPDHLVMTGFDARQVSVWNNVIQNIDQYVDNPIAKRVVAGLGGARKRGVRSICRGDVLGPRAWYFHPYVQEVLKQVDIDPFIAVFEPLGERGYAFLSLRRGWQERPFPLRARHILALFGSTTGRLLWSPEPSVDPRSTPSGLSARRCEVLQHLLNGASEKEIATQLCRSPHTVHRHVTDLYRYFGVSTRAELLAKFIQENDSRRSLLLPTSI